MAMTRLVGLAVETASAGRATVRQPYGPSRATAQHVTPKRGGEARILVFEIEHVEAQGSDIRFVAWKAFGDMVALSTAFDETLHAPVRKPGLITAPVLVIALAHGGDGNGPAAGVK
jgi:hypothetical protein